MREPGETDGGLGRPAEGWQLRRGPALVLAGLCLTLAVANFALLLQNQELKRLLAAARLSAQLAPGDRLPVLRGQNLKGTPSTVDFHGPRKTVLLLLSPRCGWCIENMDNWLALTRGLDRRKYDFLVLSLLDEGLDEYVALQRLTDLPVVTRVDLQSDVALKLVTTPQTLVVSPGGVVEQVWIGALHGPSLRAAESYFGVQLPGIRHPGLLAGAS